MTKFQEMLSVTEVEAGTFNYLMYVVVIILPLSHVRICLKYKFGIV
jgi:hypothetical protein